MFPSMTFYYIANIRTGDVVILGNADMYFFAISTITNIYNILLSKFREVQLFTTYSIAVFIPINKIADTGIPAKVINVIVQAVSIVVARFQTWRTWADKCSQYKLMDESENMTIIVEQTNTQITAAFIKGKFFDIRFFQWFSCVWASEIMPMIRAYSAKIAYLVSWVISNRFPFFIHGNLQNNSAFGKDLNVSPTRSPKAHIINYSRYVLVGDKSIITDIGYNIFCRKLEVCNGREK